MGYIAEERERESKEGRSGRQAGGREGGGYLVFTMFFSVKVVLLGKYRSTVHHNHPSLLASKHPPQSLKSSTFYFNQKTLVSCCRVSARRTT